MNQTTDKWSLGGHEFTSRFILGSGKFSLDLVKACVENAGTEIVTLAIRRANEGGLANILDYIPENVTHIGYIEGNIPQNFIQSKKNGHLNQKRQAAAHRARFVFCIQRRHLLLHLLVRFGIGFFLILVLNLLNLRLQTLHFTGRALLLHGQRNHQGPHHERKQNNRDGH